MSPRASPPLWTRDRLAGEHSSTRKESLTTGDRIVVVVEELEIPFAQFE